MHNIKKKKKKSTEGRKIQYFNSTKFMLFQILKFIKGNEYAKDKLSKHTFVKAWYPLKISDTIASPCVLKELDNC